MPVGMRNREDASSARGRVQSLASCAAAISAAVATGVPVAGAAERGYEQVSPVDKNGNEAGAQSGQGVGYAFATADGTGLLYSGGGPQGGIERGSDRVITARRSADGWSVRAAIPAPGVADVTYRHTQNALQPADDLRRFVFAAPARWTAEQPPEIGGNQTEALYAAETGRGVAWVTRPTNADPYPKPNEHFTPFMFYPAGGSADLRTFYFSYPGILLAEDEPRRPLVGSAGGFYRVEDGHVENVGVLPDGTRDPEGAAPAGATSPTGYASQNNMPPETFMNQVSADGSKALFVSPDPAAGSARPSQLYMVIDGRRSVLVSKSQITGDAAPSGAAPMQPPFLSQFRSFAYGARDGSNVYFQSTDQLTTDAPSDGLVKGYRYDVATDTVRYLPGLTGTVLAGSDDASRVLFLSEDQTKVGVWSDGVVKQVANLTLPVIRLSEFAVAPSRATADGAVFVFQTNAEVAGHPNPEEAYQVYRYELASSKLDCVSCPAAGTPIGDARISYTVPSPGAGVGRYKGNRGMSDDGSRIYFDTPQRLTARDVNGRRDVYEWEAGSKNLLSSGTSDQDSFVLDNSASGDDVFFATTEGLDPADNDGAYDVYDARVGGGFPQQRPPVPCAADCQGPPPAVPAATPAASITFSGPGNVGPEPDAPAAGKVRLKSPAVRQGRVTLSVTVPGPGRLSVSGNGVRRITRTVSRAATYRVTAKLTSGAQRVLRRRGRVTLGLRVGFTPTRGASSSASVRFTAKRAKQG